MKAKEAVFNVFGMGIARSGWVSGLGIGNVTHRVLYAWTGAACAIPPCDNNCQVILAATRNIFPNPSQISAVELALHATRRKMKISYPFKGC